MTETLRFAQGDEGMRRFTCAYAPSKARSSVSTGKLGYYSPFFRSVKGLGVDFGGIWGFLEGWRGLGFFASLRMTDWGSGEWGMGIGGTSVLPMCLHRHPERSEGSPSITLSNTPPSP